MRWSERPLPVTQRGRRIVVTLHMTAHVKGFRRLLEVPKVFMITCRNDDEVRPGITERGSFGCCFTISGTRRHMSILP